jgi:hypothetical protein
MPVSDEDAVTFSLQRHDHLVVALGAVQLGAVEDADFDRVRLFEYILFNILNN